MPIYNRDISELEKHAILWWPNYLIEANATISIIPKLLESQDDFLNILSLSKKTPYQIFDIITATEFSANLFLKHLCVLADYGGEPIQRLGKSFTNIFPESKVTFSWKGESHTYNFKALPTLGLGNKKLKIDGQGLLKDEPLSDIYQDMIILLLYGSTSEVSHEAALESCQIGTLLGNKKILYQFIKQRYINVSRITGGATANSLGQLAQTNVLSYISNSLGETFNITSNGTIPLSGYDKDSGMPFDIVVEKNAKYVGIEISFQVTTNSTIERKAGQAAARKNLMDTNGYHIAYILDGAGNFQRSSAITTICQNSECTVAYAPTEFDILVQWIRKTLD